MLLDPMLDSSSVQRWAPAPKKLRKLHPIVQVVENTASEINDLLNAIGLRVSLLRHQADSSATEAEMARLAGLVEKATRSIQRLQAYTRAEELVALMRRNRARKRVAPSGMNGPPFLAQNRQRTALLIADASVDDSAIRECLEHSGCRVVEANSSTDGLKLLQSNPDFDHIVCDAAFLAESGWKFAAELSRAAPDSRVYVLHRPRNTKPE